MSTATLFDLTPENPAYSEAAPGDQWRLAEVQLANWGTFDKEIHRLPIARRGHLITGPSGSGKSSLLDAIAAVLTPDKWLRFNVAAQSAGARADQRSIVSYVRGAWSRTADAAEDRVVSRYLRPGATWSGIVLRYENPGHKPVSLVRLFFLRGTGTANSDVSDLCLLDRSAVDLADLQDYVRSGIEARRIKAAYPDAVVTTAGAHGKFYARLRSVFGIGHESALQLLHKTQSAKSLDSLDQLFREHMLERPGTFELAQTAVEQFGELSDAHAHVSQLRMQRDHLAGLRAGAREFEQAQETAEKARVLAAAVQPYIQRRRLELTRAEHALALERIAGLAADAEEAAEAARTAEEDFEAAQRRSMAAGGADAEALQLRIRDAQEAALATRDRWDSLRRQLAQAGIEQAPASAAEFSQLQAEIARALEAADASGGPSHEQHEQHERFFAARKELAGIDADIAELRRSGSTVPAPLLEVRRQICAGVDLPESALPFAAELIEVLPEHREWTGAIERVLRPLALTVLVRTEHLPAVRRWVDSQRIRARLVFEEVSSQPHAVRQPRSELSLVHRVAVKDDRFGRWVRAALAERFDVACVESPDELAGHSRAVTRGGQLKASRTRYEKDDRRAIDDRSSWVLGDREAKLEAYLERRRQVSAELEAAREVVDGLARERDAVQRRSGLLSGLRELSWASVDHEAAERIVAEHERRLAELTGDDGDLQAAVEAVEDARHLRDVTRREAEDARHLMRMEQDRRDDLAGELERLEAGVAAGRIPEVPEDVAAVLARRFASAQEETPALAEAGQTVAARLREEQDRAQAAAARAESTVTRLAVQFKERWPGASADLTADAADRAGYIAILESIETHGLPDHEARFLRILQERSRDLIGELLSDVLGAPREIEDRVDRVNDSLGRSKFDEGRYLRIRPRVRRSETVNRFISDLRTIAEGTWDRGAAGADGADGRDSSAGGRDADGASPSTGGGKDAADLEAAETAFEILAELMRRFASNENVDRVWRNQCLDTRLHVTFLAEEVDENGRAHTAYDSGAALSGGQQQKLVVFCLAAALRYQLAEPEETVSRYGTIVLDEAFDKADTRYTRMALDVFVEFGFHLVLATPQKLLQTIEPYVGAATSVDNPSRQRSVVSTMTWAEQGWDEAASAAGTSEELEALREVASVR
ncbi:ATP-binding protein [Brevibacterium album]|uniref:ATP-binding protein n=1 Tax=Brevibacterium album TaxID=417948 RepID=UPI0004026F41|nr:SbcC/MukB-like Walker B domain-containing protein [Brevibacterium album]